MGSPRFRRLPHVADCRIVVWGDDAETLVANAIAGTLRHALEGPIPDTDVTWVPLAPWPTDLAVQLVFAVNEALYLLFSRRVVVSSFRIAAGHGWLATTPLGNHPIAREIKAATFHALRPVDARGRICVTLTLDL